ncbi:MAG: hypothetical protein F6K28_29765, partial [Microcoleus sp. SIO2G3]|nr:hypothetical protein [Microcoleus sp. SIO2G3]
PHLQLFWGAARARPKGLARELQCGATHLLTRRVPRAVCCVAICLFAIDRLANSKFSLLKGLGGKSSRHRTDRGSSIPSP